MKKLVTLSILALSSTAAFSSMHEAITHNLSKKTQQNINELHEDLRKRQEIHRSHQSTTVYPSYPSTKPYLSQSQTPIISGPVVQKTAKRDLDK